MGAGVVREPPSGARGAPRPLARIYHQRSSRGATEADSYKARDEYSRRRRSGATLSTKFERNAVDAVLRGTAAEGW